MYAIRSYYAFLDGLGNPVDAAIEGDELFLDRGHLDEPALSGIVDQRGVAAPAIGIAVLKRQRGKELVALFQRVEDGLVRVFDEHAVPGRAADHVAAGVDQLHKRQFPFLAHARVVFAERGRDVDDA